MLWILPAFLALVAAVLILRDPRRMSCAYWSGAAAASVALSALTAWAPALQQVSATALPLVLLGVLLVAFALVLAASAFLVWAGIVLLRREGRSFSHALSLMLGVGVLAYLAAVLAADRLQLVALLPFLLSMAPPVFFFSFELVCFLVYSALYGFVVRTWGRAGRCVVVLGAGLVGGEVSPLLAARVDLGLSWFAKAQSKWPNPVLVMSGGQGSDESVPEGVAMARYALLREPGLVGSNLLVEDASATTEQNLLLTRALLLENEFSGPWTVATSDFHAFRAANLMSRLSLPGNAVGARTTRYFWASAKLREFVALLTMYWRGTTAVAILSMVPALGLAITRLLTLF